MDGRTEGWIAALQLAALSMQGRESISCVHRGLRRGRPAHRRLPLPRRCSGRQPDDVRDFLLTYLHPRLGSPVRSATRSRVESGGRNDAGRAGTGEPVPAATGRPPPVVSLSPPVRRRVAGAPAGGVRRADGGELHRRASRWLEEQGEPAGGHRPRAGRSRLRAGRRPDGVRDSGVVPHPAGGRLCVAGCGRLPDEGATRSAGARRRLRRLTRGRRPSFRHRRAAGCPTSSNCFARAPGKRTVAGATSAGRSSGGRPRGLSGACRGNGRRCTAPVWRWRAGTSRARSPRPAGARPPRRGPPPRGTRRPPPSPGSRHGKRRPDRGPWRLRRGIEGLHARRIPLRRPGLTIALADMLRDPGPPPEAMRTFERGLERPEQRAAGAPGRGGHARGASAASSASATTRRRPAAPAAAASWASTTVCRRTATAGGSRWPGSGGRRRPDGALELLDEAERLYVGDFSPKVRPVPALRARLLLARGGGRRPSRGRAARPVRGRRPQLSARVRARHPRPGVPRPVRARAGRGLIQQAVGLLDRLLSRRGRRPDGQPDRDPRAQALASQAHGDAPAALIPLQRALTLAEPEGYVRIFVDEGPPMAALLRAARRTGAPAMSAGCWPRSRDRGEARPAGLWSSR